MIKYFPTKDYFIKNDKNLLVTTLLSLFLGYLGAHRIYLNKKISGFLMFSLFISSFFLDKLPILYLLMLIWFFETFYYFILILQSRQEKQNKEPEEISINPIEIEDSEKVVPTPPLEVKVDWVELLNKPITNEIDNGYIQNEINRFYTSLCDFLNEEMAKEGRSLLLITEELNKTNLYYRNLLYTLYCISEGYVVNKFFNIGGQHFLFAHELLILTLQSQGFNISYKSTLLPKMKELQRNVGILDINTQMEFANKSTKEINEMTFMMKSSGKPTFIENLNVPLEVPLINKNINAQFDILWDYIIQNIGKLEFNKYIKLYIKLIINGQLANYVDNDCYGIFNYLILSLTNNNIYYYTNERLLSVNKDIEELIPQDLINKTVEISNTFNNKINANDKEIIFQSFMYIYKVPYSFKQYILMLPDYAKYYPISKMFNYNDLYIKTAKELLKEDNNSNIDLLLLFGLDLKGKLTKLQKKKLDTLIHPDRISLYEHLKKGKELNIKVINNLNILQIEDIVVKEKIEKKEQVIRKEEQIEKEPQVKKISLDLNKLQSVNEELENTVDIIDKFLDNDNDLIENENNNLTETKPQVEEKDNIKKDKMLTTSILKEVIENDGIPLEIFNSYAEKEGKLTNAFLNEINKELYDYTEDQTLIIKDNRIIIDEFYVEIIKEMLL